MHWLQIDVTNLDGLSDGSREIRSSGPVEGFRSGLGWIDDGDSVHIDLVLRSVSDSVEAVGEVRGKLHLSCSRCLVEYQEGFRLDVDEKFYFDPTAAELKEGYEVRDQVVNLEPMLRDVIVLSIPMRPVHTDDCKGLCPECGADLNASDCKHAKQQIDIRWAPLQSLMASQSGGDDEEVEK